jgi:hypothetical protein
MTHSTAERLPRRYSKASGARLPLVNGAALLSSGKLHFDVPKMARVQVMTDELVLARRDPVLWFPRQIQHFNQLVDYILNTQDKPHLRRALQVYFKRLSQYYHDFLGGDEEE